MSYYLLDNPNPNGTFFYTGRRTCQHGYTKPHLIVLHSAENLPDFDPPDMGAESVARYASTTERSVSWHTTVDSDSIIDMLPSTATAWHVRGFNSCSVGIEIATQHDAWLKAPEEWLYNVYDNTAKALKEFSVELGIPMRVVNDDPSQRGVVTHAVLDPTRRKDPGEAFPLDWVVWMAAHDWRYGGTHSPAPDSPPPPQPPQPRPVTPVALVGPPSVTLRQMQKWGIQRGGTLLFTELGAYAWQFSLEVGIDPAVSYAVMAHETNFGKFTGVLDLSFNNWGGIKKNTGGGDYEPGAHKRFISHREGVLAVVQHAAGYAGIQLPAPVVDPRYELVRFNAYVDVIPHENWTWAKDTHDDKVAQFVHEMRAV